MQNILITGGSGLIGNSITKLLVHKGKEVAWLSRNPDKQEQKSFYWDPEKDILDQESLYWADGIIHLAGAGVADKRWTDSRKKEILDSRVKSSLLLFQELQKIKDKPKAFISSSAVGYYGIDTGEKLVFEGDPPGKDFLASVVKEWETATEKIQDLKIRTVLLRIGIVLSKDGGALPEILKPPVAAPLGDGKQYMSWIHIEDLSRMFVHALENPGLSGIYNAVGPVPVTNRGLTKKAAHFKGKPFIGVGVPGFALKIILGEMAEMVIGGNRVSSEKMEGTGFRYLYSDLNQALKQIFK
ncbi:TIGR01777 family oxidoreductase [Cyclobacterium jeungdonense]|uniref:TIGR01777 family oxidoreductase n=1 Tax=Cyclobacterium jeungdonense TaxID=708087 RepID=A0ABT8C6Z2_9BACT|nr:TIGR01777 family oxidoreductase [Cyclobacterium jeungdonense]MDN3687809.1 TIGR01777 family oxidoreductase [Cyclobacterium jeungdonense]